MATGRKQTFAQYLIENTLPDGIEITKPIDKKYLNDILIKVAEIAPNDYPEVVIKLKNLGDRLSTYEAVSFGLDEIDVPDRAKRDEVVNKYQRLTQNETDPSKVINHLVNLQTDLAKINRAPGLKDDASLMMDSALGGKATQMMKLRVSPGVVGGHDGKIVNEIFTKSYAEGVTPLQYWLGATESRRNLSEGQVSTSAPGELSKVISNVLNSAVVSMHDCGTKRGIELFTKDDDIQGRYLAANVGSFIANSLVTPEMQQELLRKGIDKVFVRSPQTCSAPDGSVCILCMGLRPGTGKPYNVGDNVGMLTAGSLAEPLTQMTLSAKHSTAMAGEKEGLTGEKGFRMFVESPEKYTNRQVLCEVYGEITRITMAPQGGKIITIRQNKPVPDRYIVNAMKNKTLKMHWDYYVPPNLKVLDGIEQGTEVYPGMELTNGIENIRDIARLRNLGAARSAAAQGMYDIYKNTGSPMARVHFELLARNAHPYVKIEKAPSGFEFKRGEIVNYNKLEDSLAGLHGKVMSVPDAIGKVLTEGVLDVTAGTEITKQLADRLMSSGIHSVKVTTQVEVSPATTPLTRVVNQSDDWIAGLNHRYLVQGIKDAASYGKRSNVHGYNPITAYAVGTEITKDDKGRY